MFPCMFEIRSPRAVAVQMFGVKFLFILKKFFFFLKKLIFNKDALKE